MKRYAGGETVPKGLYLNLSTWEFVPLYQESRILPGDAGVKHLKVPTTLAVVTGPFAGLAFIIFLPLAGIIGIVGFIAYKLWQWTLLMAHKMVQPAVIGWKPGIAFFVRRGGEPKGQKATAEEEKLAKLKQEITERREKGEK